MFVFGFQNSAAGTPTVNVTLSGSDTWHLICLALENAMTTGGVEGFSARVTGSASTTHLTSDVASTGAGATLSFLSTGGTTSVAPTAGETFASSLQETRLFAFFEAHGSAGTYNHTVDTFASNLTTPESTSSIQAIVTVLEADDVDPPTATPRRKPLLGIGEF
jgi:hypothetical protein